MHLVGFITKKFVTMHGHMNVKFSCILMRYPNFLQSFAVKFVFASALFHIVTFPVMAPCCRLLDL
jgi:hypothetical protein